MGTVLDLNEELSIELRRCSRRNMTKRQAFELLLTMGYDVSYRTVETYCKKLEIKFLHPRKTHAGTTKSANSDQF